MTATRLMHVEVELMKWLLLAALAAALVLALATGLAAADPMLEPNRLPDDMALMAQPMEAAPTIRPYFPEQRPQLELPAEAVAARMWTILENHRALCHREALAGWDEIHLVRNDAPWRDIARGAAFLAAGDLDRAAEMLGEAQQLEPAHPVAAYFTGILYLERAAAAVRMPDRVLPRQAQFVAHVPGDWRDARQTHQLLAAQHLRLALANAGMVRLDERLVVGPEGMEDAIVVPRVGDLLVALGAGNFAGKAHHLLFGLALDRGELDEAELNLDRAVATGIAPLYGYEDLAQAYVDHGRQADAVRAGRKDIQANYPGLWQAGQEMQGALNRLWEAWEW